MELLLRHLTRLSLKFPVNRQFCTTGQQLTFQCIKIQAPQHRFHIDSRLLLQAENLTNKQNSLSLSFVVLQKQQQQCLFHTSPRRSIHPLLLALIRPLGQATAIITGRYFRKWWRGLPDDRKQAIRHRFRLSGWRIAGVVSLLMAVGMINYYMHIQQAPLTGRKRFIAFTPEQFHKIALFQFETQWNQLKESIVAPEHPLYAKIVDNTNRIVKANQDLEFFRKQTWTVIVVDSAEGNAFVLPTGHIFVYTGLMKNVQNDDQLAVVLGHEMAHALLGHGAEQISFAQMMDLYIIIVMAAIWAFLPNDGIALVAQWFYKRVIDLLLHLPYNRKLEREADEVGLLLIAKACYDVRETSTFWSLMAIREETDDDELSMPEFLSTHPAHETRAQHLDDLVPQASRLRLECKCPMLPGKDPRQQLQLLRSMMQDAQQTQTNNTVAETGVETRKVPLVAPAS